MYAIYLGGALKYIGETNDLARRFGRRYNYGQIAGTQSKSRPSTNHRINAHVCAAAKSGKTVEVFFHPFPGSKEERRYLESELIREKDPEWNDR